MSRRISDASWDDDDFAIPALRIFEALGSRGSRERNARRKCSDDGVLEPGDGRGRATDGHLGPAPKLREPRHRRYNAR